MIKSHDSSYSEYYDSETRGVLLLHFLSCHHDYNLHVWCSDKLLLRPGEGGTSIRPQTYNITRVLYYAILSTQCAAVACFNHNVCAIIFETHPLIPDKTYQITVQCILCYTDAGLV